METFNNLYTWQGLLATVIFLLAIYWLLKLILFLIEQIGIKNALNKKLVGGLDKVLLVYKPVSAILILLGFISINYIIHSLLLLIVGVFAFQHIKNYINGIFLKINPLIQQGALISIDTHGGEIKKMLPFGMIINTETGERYINYSAIEKDGFAISSNENSVLRQTLYLDTEISSEDILDYLFDNPILNFKEQPTLRNSEKENILKLQYTLEVGASTEDLVAYLNQNNITTSLTNTQIN